MDQRAPRDVCRNYWNTGKCSYPNCKFKHETNPKLNNENTLPKSTEHQNPKTTNNNKQNTSTEKHGLPRFHSLIDRDFRHQHDMRKFVLSALKEPDTGDIVLALGDTKGNGIKKLQEILQCEFETRAGKAASKYSFQRIIVPLCHLLTLPQFQNSPHATQLRVIYGVVFSEILFFPKVISCCEELMKYGHFTPERVDEEETVWTPQNWKDVIKPIVKLFFTILTRVADSSADDSMSDTFDGLQNLAVREPDSEINALIKKSKTAIDSVRQKEVRELEAKKTSRENLDLRLALSLQFETEIPHDVLNQPGPGEIHPEGPRHNNDFADFRQIKIVPTENEILCLKEPYIPTPQGSEHVANPVDRYLDIHFRQLREDMLASVRRGVQGFLNQNALAQMKKSDVKFWVKPSIGKMQSEKSDSVALNVYRNISISDPLPDLFRGVCFRVEFDQLPNLVKMNQRQRQDYWKIHAGSRQLDVSSLVCIALGVNSPPKGGTTADKLIFATIAEKKDVDLIGDRCSINIQLLESATTADLATYVSHLSKPTDNNNQNQKENVMLQVRGHFFPGYEPVLSALQAHTVESLPFTDFIVEEPDLNNMRPEFLKDDTVFDLSVIQKSTTGRKLRCEVGDYEELRQTLHYHADNLILDNTQIDAFAAALTRKVALIQGPPGTGKTYIGIQIVRALLANSSGTRANNWQQQGRIAPVQEAPIPALHPILCICYTNHALDQFLEGLVQAGISVDNIVRAGGRSQSEILAERNLHKLQFHHRTRGEQTAFGILKAEAKELEDTIKDGVTSLHSKTYDPFLRWLKEQYPEHYNSITLRTPEDEEGSFKTATKPEKMLFTWLTQETPFVQQPQPTQQQPEVFQTQNKFTLLKKTEIFGIAQNASIQNDYQPRRLIQPNDQPRDFKELINVGNSWTMSMVERKLFMDVVHDEWKREISRQLERDIRTYNKCVTESKEINDATQLRVLKGAQIVGFTTSGCAKYQTLLKALQPRVVICEEAGEVLESHVLASLTSGSEQLILIGDHLQLRPKVTEYSLSKDSRNGYDLDISLFERLVNKYQRKYRDEDLHQLGLLCTLDTQRRMRPPIADILRRTLYPTLQDSEKVKSYPRLQGFANDLWFFDHNWLENTDVGENSVSVRSYSNQKEAEMVVELVRYAIRQGYKKEEIAVLTPYVGQLILLRNFLSQKKMLLQLEEQDLLLLEAAGIDDTDLDDSLEPSNENDNKIQAVQRVSLKERVRLSTVDNFQGEEAELVIISSVRCNEKGRTGFLKISNRVNVMLSRAKHGMIVLGSSRTIKKSVHATMFHEILKILENKNAIGNFIDLRCKNHQQITRIKEPQDFEHLDGGCVRPCNYRMSCGHSCHKLCHPDEAQHNQSECREPCQKIIPSCGHPCQNLCFEKCGGCDVMNKVQLPCGHTLEIACSQATKVPLCTEKVVVKMPLCQHTAEIPCWKSIEIQQQQPTLNQPFDPKIFHKNLAIFSCSHKCESLLEDCSHPCNRSCGMCSFATISESKTWTNERKIHGKCMTACTRPLFCGHLCGDGTCHPQGSCPPCKLPCFNRCEHSSCGKKCDEPCDACVQECTWTCTCGKKLSCPMVCGSPCTRLPCDSRCPKTLMCGHQCPSLCGETCPDKSYCSICAPPDIKEQVVDMIMMTKLVEHNPNESPLLILPCKHALTVESLDGIVGIEKVYNKNKDGKWIGMVPLDALSEEGQAVLQCPHCRSPISGIRRYGRMLNLLLIHRIRQKHLLYIQAKSANYQQQINQLSTNIQGLISQPNPPSASTAKLKKEINLLINAIMKDCAECEHNAPTQKLYNVDRASAQKGNIQPELVKLIPPNSQPLLHLLHIHLKAQMIRLQFLCNLWQDKPAKKGKENSKTKANDNNNTGPSQLDSIQTTYALCVDTAKKLLKYCKQAKAKKSQQTAWEEYALLHMEFINGLAAVPVPKEVKPEPSIRDRQLFALEALKEVLKNLPPSKLHEKAEEIEKKLKDFAFYQPVSREEMIEIKKAMDPDIGSGAGSFGGHWYQCPNGHIYTIGECGGAMQTSTCNECGATIGGSGHRLLNNNAHATQFLQNVNGQSPPPNWRQDLERNEQLARQFQQ